jgi:hypothetical protein
MGTSEILGENAEICRIARDIMISFDTISASPRFKTYLMNLILDMAAAQEEVKPMETDSVNASTSNGVPSESASASAAKPLQADDAAGATGRFVFQWENMHSPSTSQFLN